MAKPLGGLPKNLPLGKNVTATVSRPLQVGSRLTCADNSGAKELQIIAVRGYRGVRRRVPCAGVADMVIASVKKGRPDMRKKLVHAIIIRQKQAYTRYNGAKVRFHDNAAVVVGEEGMPKGTEVKGAVAREAAERWIKIGGLASIVI
ncbi:MAG TPA: 50S ribosomal protein L14 [Candidatus Altiarchaeales archaeon]|nr:50S ribosomal protein L14 [Candidatus Altiarchaeales archaeon]